MEEFKVSELAMLRARGLPSTRASLPWAARAGVFGKAAQIEVSIRSGSDDRRCGGREDAQSKGTWLQIDTGGTNQR